jgi:hypothetical protein
LEVDRNEILVRGIVHPMFYSISKNSIKPEAFLPPPNKRDVSLLRHSYTNDNFCKNHSKNLIIGSNEYCGLATFCHYHIEIINNQPANITRTEILGTPIDGNGNYIYRSPIFYDTIGLPMHADLLYEQPMIKGAVNTNYRKYASQIVKIANYFKDPFPQMENWKGDKITWK